MLWSKVVAATGLCLLAGSQARVIHESRSADWTSWPQQCTDETKQIRQDFEKMEPEKRKEFTDAINCIRTQPSNLDQSIYSGAINKYFDYATVHINLTQTVHLSGFFLAWHRMFLHIFEQDLKETCGYTGTMPYWNWPATAARGLENSPIFNGDEYSMSGNGYFIDQGPYVLAPTFSLPHGSGGGCIESGPFAGMSYTMREIPGQLLSQGGELPPTAFTKNETCLTRDLNTPVAQLYLNWTAFEAGINAPDMASFETALNGVFGGASLGLHSGAHFSIGPPLSNIFVSVQDPIWWPLHTMLDNAWVQWQKKHPDQVLALYGTETANNVPPSANVTLDTWTPNWGYFHETMQMKDLMSTTAGPFCYDYDFEDESGSYSA